MSVVRLTLSIIVFTCILSIAVFSLQCKAAEGPHLHGYDKAIESGKVDIPFIKEFVHLFPKSRHFITYYTGEFGKPTWTSKIGLFGRYVLTVQTEITFDAARERIVGFTDPTFYLSEVDKIENDPVQRSTTVARGELQMQFGIEKWKLVVAADGNLERLGVEIKQNKPVAGFEEYWNRNDTD